MKCSRRSSTHLMSRVQPTGGPRHEDLLGPRVHDLDAEAATHVGGDALDLGQGEPELGRDGRPHTGGGLRGGVEQQRLLVAVPAGVDALALHRDARAALDLEGEGQRVRGAGDGGAGVTDLLHHVRGDVAGCLLVHEHVAGAGLLQTHHDRQLLVVDPDPLAGVLGDVAVGRDDHDHGLAHVVDQLGRQAVAGHRVGQRRVRDQQRQAVGHLAVQVLVRVDRDDALDVERVGHVDVEDAGVGVGAPHERRGERVVAEVVEVAAVAGQQARVLLALDRCTEHLRGHDVASRSLVISAARRTDLMMFW